MKKLIKTCKTPLILSSMLFSLAIPAMAGNDTYSPAIRKVELQDDSSLKITFTVDAESMWFCPGANGKKAGKDIELTFVRAKYDKRPKVDYPMKSAAKEDISQVVTIPAPFDAVFIRDGKNLVKIYPPASALVAQAAEAPLPITVEGGGSATRGTGIAMHREVPTLTAGSELTFLGRYEPEEDRISFLDPHSGVMVAWPRRLYWRIYFTVATGPGSLKSVSRDLNSAEADALQKLPAIKKFVEKHKVGWDPGHGPDQPKLSLHEVYAGKVPEEFAKLDARDTIVGVYCDNLGRTEPELQQAFHLKPSKSPSGLYPGMIATFSGTIHPNQPELSPGQKEERKLHRFNLELTATRPIRVQLDEATAHRLFKKEISKAMVSLQGICKRESLIFEFDSEKRPVISWMDERMVVSGLITPRPDFSMKPVPYATASVFFDPATSQPERIVFVRRVHQDPRD